MSNVKAMILRAPGINCNRETAYAFEAAGAQTREVHVNDLIADPRRLADYQILALPGGFSFGDDIASGQVLSRKLKYRLAGPLQQFVADGKLIIGICNGFQVLVKLGLLPGTGQAEGGDRPALKQEAALTYNESGKFEDRWVHLKLDPDNRCVFTAGLKETIYLPVRHGEGRFIPRDAELLNELRNNGQIVFRYVDAEGRPAGYPANPNGAVDNIAGICDPTGRVFGLMPHPEVFIRPSEHPHWTRGGVTEADGTRIFQNAVEFVRNI
jgi:phosphoribosylformylglycinamidine synthase I